MTGADVKAKFETYIDEVGSGYIDDTRLNTLFFKADNNLVTKAVNKYGLTNEITREMMPLILEANGLTPVASVIDISQTSVQVPNYYSIILVTITTPFMGAPLTVVADEKPFNEFTSNYATGTARYPKYWFTADSLNLEPSNITTADIVYFRKAIQIDVTDAVTPVPYNDEYLLNLISHVIDDAGFMGRDQFLMMASQIDRTQ